MTAHAGGSGYAPRIVIRPGVIRRNTAAIRDRFDGRLVGVTKAVTGDPAVARAMLDGGAAGLADSRTANLARLREHVAAETTQLLVPMRSALDQLIRVADRSLHSEPAVVEDLDAVASRHGTTHDVILMVDTGDRREGVLPADVVPTLERLETLSAIEVVGLGTNLGCFGGVVPTRAKMAEFVALVERAEDTLGRRFPVVSGGSSVTLPLVEADALPARINELRIGEALLLGTDLTRNRRVPYLAGDAFELRAEVVECKHKPSTPDGERGFNVAGDRPAFADRGDRDRAIIALGKQDTVPAELIPVEGGIEVVGASSDHTVLDVTDTDRTVQVGDTLGFRPGYHALVRAFTSDYVRRAVEQVSDGANARTPARNSTE